MSSEIPLHEEKLPLPDEKIPLLLGAGNFSPKPVILRHSFYTKRRQLRRHAAIFPCLQGKSSGEGVAQQHRVLTLRTPCWTRAPRSGAPKTCNKPSNHRLRLSLVETVGPGNGQKFIRGVAKAPSQRGKWDKKTPAGITLGIQRLK